MSTIIILTHEPLDVEKVTRMVTSPQTGAVSLFVGTTRDHFEGKKVSRLEYEAYEPMAKKELAKVCDRIREKWNVKNIAIYHRLGKVDVCEASVIVAITSEHRKESLEAVSFAIDDLKASAPIWKKEIYDGDNISEWKQNKECSWSEGKDNTDVIVADVDMDEVQLSVSNDEINRRMNAFMNRKRDEINQCNVLEFCDRHLTDPENPENSCARTDACHAHKKEGHKSHLRQSLVVNTYGPQTNNYVDTSYNPLEKSMSIKSGASKASNNKDDNNLPFAITERLVHLEKKTQVKLNPVPKDIYSRLKALEDRLNYLEGISPEYFNKCEESSSKKGNILPEQASTSSTVKPIKTEDNQTVLSALNTRIQELQATFKVKSESN